VAYFGTMRAIIIGGGIGGMTAAIGLRQAGIDVAVFERAPEPREVGVGISLWSNAIRALKKIGAADRVIEAGGEIRVGELRTSLGRLLSRIDVARMNADLGPSLLLHRADLLDALLACLPSGVVTFGARCTRVEHDPTGATPVFTDGRRERADVLIGADGINSVVSAALHGETRARYSGYTCWRAIVDVPAELVAPGYVSEYWGRGSRFGIGRLGGGRSGCVYWYATRNAPPEGRDGDVKAELGALFGRWTHPIPEVLALTDRDAVIRSDIVDRPPLPRSCPWGAGRITLLGDAAHPTTPNLGQGAAMAIESSVVLARLLGQFGADPAQTLRSYERQRRARTAMITNVSWHVGRVGQWSSRAACWLRDNLTELTPTCIIAANQRRIMSVDV
jgi:2-polyprenyl-6-methoxyphenol hydroxylase-like FAD-dependent oxidoreductase